jgi:uncharacterized protein YidB (DUF937 family)
MTLSPLILLLLGVLAYRTYKGEGRLAEMLRQLSGAAPDAASSPSRPESYASSSPTAPSQSARPRGDSVAPAASAGMGGNLGGTLAGGMAGGLIGSGLHELLNRFQNGGYGDVANSWISTGPNRAISPGELHDALGSDTVNSLAQEAGLSDIDVLSGLSRDLPGAVDELTPTGGILDDATFGEE